MASAIWVNRLLWPQAIVFITVDGESFTGDASSPELHTARTAVRDDDQRSAAGRGRRRRGMACDVITLRPGPAGESCARVGDSGYTEIAFFQCRRYIALLRLAIGPEPDGARLRVRRSDSDFDPYIDVVIEYDDQNAAAADYAIRCERDAPTRWR